MKNFVFVLIVTLLGFAGCTRFSNVGGRDLITFHLKRPGAKAVYFYSSLDGYKPHRTQHVGDGAWEIRVPADTEFRYFYNADGIVVLPPCEEKEKDDFGSENCVFVPPAL